MGPPRGANVNSTSHTKTSTEKQNTTDQKQTPSVVSVPNDTEKGSSTSSDSVSAQLVLERLENISREIQTVTTEVRELRSSIEFSQKDIDEIKNRLDKLEGNQLEFTSQAHEIETLKSDNLQLQERLEKLELYSRRDNLIITGLQETEDENPAEVVAEFFSTLVEDTIPIMRCHRLGGKSSSGASPRPMIVRFTSYTDRMTIWGKRFNLKGRDVWLKEDFPDSVEAKRQRLYPILKEAKKAGMKAKLVVDKLVVEGITYTVENLASLPERLQPGAISTKRTKKHVLFYGRHSKYSNFHPCSIRDNGLLYNCAEQMYQHKKATEIGDVHSARKIMAASNPRDQKRLGDKVKPPSVSWIAENGERLMKETLMAKFKQNDSLKQDLLSTCGLCFVECNPYDTYWSCGMKLSDSAGNPSNWTGENKLGLCLDETRRALAS